jgi:hypothetical protein
MEKAEIDYFERRAEEERAAAQDAADERAAQSHRELAEEYLKRASGEREETAPEEETNELGTLGREFRIVP